MKFRVVIFSFLFSFACETQEPEEHISWKKKRYDALFTDDGYLNEQTKHNCPMKKSFLYHKNYMKTFQPLRYHSR